MSLQPLSDPYSIASKLQQYLVNEGWNREEITTEIVLWESGDYMVSAWHSLGDDDAEENTIGYPEKIEYTYHPDGTIEREHLRLDTPEMWNVIDQRSIE